MIDRKSKDTIHQTLSAPVPAEHAFEVFTNGLDSWWPHEFTWSGDVLETIAIEPREGGRCFERGPHGFEVDWGRVLVWEPPHRLVITWQISPQREPQPDPDKASKVDVRFEQEDNKRTRVIFEHRGLARHGGDSQAYREALASPQGWPYILENYMTALQEE